ncbi:MFS transporter [Streptomyces sp. NPDC002012]|uniref:MFS transporter n=1 Tax=Streptomyces sp. NPDC002012 TaxID=3154532 RepID=UPI003328DC95
MNGRLKPRRTRRQPEAVRATLAQPSTRLLLLLGYHTVTGYQLYILQDYIGLGRDQALEAIPLVGAVVLTTGVASLIVCGRLSDRMGRRKPFVIAATLLIGLGLSVPLLVPSLTGMLLYAALGGLGFGCYQAVDVALITQVLPSQEDAAKDLGVAGIAAHLPQVLAPALAGVVVVSLGYQPLFGLAFASCVLGALCTLPIKSVT